MIRFAAVAKPKVRRSIKKVIHLGKERRCREKKKKRPCNLKPPLNGRKISEIQQDKPN
jgi:hypothetical protein